MSTEQKISFLQNEYPALLAGIGPDAAPRWGKMNAQQMIEHMSEYIGYGYGKKLFDVLTPEEHLPKMRAFLLSDKPFRENTPNALMPDTPPPTQHGSVPEAIAALSTEVASLLAQFAEQPGKQVVNPFFGILDYEMTVQLLHKHAWHHLRQFGVTEQTGEQA